MSLQTENDAAQKPGNPEMKMQMQMPARKNPRSCPPPPSEDMCIQYKVEKQSKQYF
jgi:hypothetical protein